MKRTPVISSQIAALAYDPARREMDIEFVSHSKDKTKPNSVYRYSNVPMETFQGLVNAESIGKYFGAHIKPNAKEMPFRKLTEEEAAQ